MAWDIEEVQKAIRDVESDRTKLVQQMEVYEKAWRLDFWGADDYQIAKDKGWKLYTSPEPRNVVGMAMNLLNGKLKVNCPAYGPDGVEVRNSEVRARFLELLIEKQSQIHDMSLLEELGWFGAVRGRMVLQVAYIWNELNDDQKYFMPPIVYRALDPKACGFKRDAMGIQYAFHKYSERIENARRKYPEYFKDKSLEGIIPSQKPDRQNNTDVEIYDFWYMDKQPWHCVLIDNEFAKKPRKSQFPKIPLFERNNDPAPATKERWRSGSILDGMLGTWAELNYLHSMHITAVSKKFFPAMYFSNDEERPVPTLDMGPDASNVLPPGMKPLPGPDDRPDINLATSAIEMFSEYQQKATFPNSIYGETGQQRAAYGAHMLMSTAARRVTPLKTQVENILQEANELALCMIKKFSPDEIEMYGYNRATQKGERIALGSDMIGERYDNTVSLEVIVPGSNMQNANIAIQFKREGLLSGQTARRVGMPAEWYVPDDEHLRILEEVLEENEELKKEIMERVYFQRTGQQMPQPPPPEPPPGQQPGQPPGAMGQGPVPPVGQPPMGPPPQPMGPPPGYGAPSPAGPPQPMGPPMGMPPQPMAPPQGMPMMGPMQGTMPGGPEGLMMGSPEMMGGQSPDMMGLDQMDPETAMMMAMMNTGQMPGPQASDQMMQGNYRRR